MSIGLVRGTVELEYHDKKWEILANEFVDKLKNILKDDIVDAQHIGSTAIHNIYAKPIIDIVVGVESFDKIMKHNDELMSKGIIYRREDHPGQYLYICGNLENNIHTHYIHVVIWGESQWDNYINMRDYLNMKTEKAIEYSELKLKLAKEYPTDRSAYTEGKSKLIESIINEAKEWRKNLRFDNVYFINGTAYAGKSTMVKLLAEKYNGIACEENYHDRLLDKLNSNEFPGLTYTRDLQNWSDFIRRTPDEYEAWIKQVNKECTILEFKILEELSKQNKPVFVDTNIPVEVLREISDKEHVLIMLAEPDVSVKRFFERPDKEKQFLYQLLLKEDEPQKAIENFRECLKRVNSVEIYNEFLKSGFNVILRDDERTIEETFALVQKMLKL